MYAKLPLPSKSAGRLEYLVLVKPNCKANKNIQVGIYISAFQGAWISIHIALPISTQPRPVNDPASSPNLVMNPGHLPPEAYCTYSKICFLSLGLSLGVVLCHQVPARGEDVNGVCICCPNISVSPCTSVTLRVWTVIFAVSTSIAPSTYYTLHTSQGEGFFASAPILTHQTGANVWGQVT
ncbi:hypothetical protein KIL84_002672 [Mauremys mutica]|uniref:Uncharacterized protein n=1 Tax=Mauremys mutica TaxID=74926 RepID=A0A9D4AQN4_9SAUR|nr:hypothetical protein KIL84_002672 [Mauremys mutica]